LSRTIVGLQGLTVIITTGINAIIMIVIIIKAAAKINGSGHCLEIF
jgi:hypothetical protein